MEIMSSRAYSRSYRLALRWKAVEGSIERSLPSFWLRKEAARKDLGKEHPLTSDEQREKAYDQRERIEL